MQSLAKVIRLVSFIMILVAFVFLSFPVNHVEAGDQFNCRVSGVGVFNNMNGWYLQCDGGTRSGAPSCATVQNQWGMSWSTPGSKEAYTLAITAWLSGNNVRINGINSCTVIPDRETINGLERHGM